MDGSTALMGLANRPVLDTVAEPLSQIVRDAYQSAGTVGQRAKNFLHGVWLGHPLHPVLTDLPIGAWTVGVALDFLDAVQGDENLGAGADAAIGIGVIGALGAAVTGLTDWHVLKE